MSVYLIEYISNGKLCSAICKTEELARLYCERYGLDYRQSVSEYILITDEENIY